LLYAMVPLYALWPSPVMLMTCGTVIAHVAALPLYFAARFRSGSVKVALAFALSWLLAPSVSRVVYANTYGFQWALAGLPLLAVMMAAGLVGRWKLSTAFAVLALLTRETAAAPVFGWGVYVALFTPRRRLGVAVAGAAAAYFVLCTTVLIPNAAGSDAYARLSVYGPLGTTLGNVIGGLLTRPSLVLERMLRPESAYLVCLLTVTAAGLPVAGWRLGLASVAVLLPIVLMENSEWLSIKFWNHAPVLPFLLFSGVTLLRPAGRGGVTPADVTLPRRRNDNLAIALALLVSAAWGHYLFGFSPFAKAHEVHCGSEFLQTPDPRMTLIHKLRREIPRNRTILATERVAAHFWDYRRLYTGRRVRPVDYVLIDTSDDWDTSGLPGRLDEFLAHPHYERFSDLGPLNVLKRRSNAPPVESLP